MPLCVSRALVLLALVPGGWAVAARAAERTTVVIDAPVPASPRYSQAIALTMHLAKATGGAAVAGTDCTPACSVIVSIAPSAAPTDVILISAQGFVTDTDGTASARLTFVDGRYGTDSAFAATTDGAAYVITAQFLGSGSGQAVGNPDCNPANAENPNGDFCPSTVTTDVSLVSETSAIILGQGLEGALGDTLTLSAAVSDPNGDAAPGGTDVDGAQPIQLAGVNVTFFYDQNDNGRADGNEALATVVTNAAGVASTDFVLDPQFVRAGTYETGVHAEFSGDAHFGVARASTRLVVHPAGVDVTRTVIEADPETIPADGFSTSTLRARLVDSFNNPLDENSEDHVVVFTADLGTLVDAVERDPLNGTYTQALRAQRKPGTATITVSVDGVTGTTKTVEITGEGGCHCGAATDVPAASALLALVRMLPPRRRRRASKGAVTA